MPCYIVQTTSVKFQAKYKSLLFDALRRAKIMFREYNDRETLVKKDGRIAFSIMWEEGVIKVEAKRQVELRWLINKVKREYSKQVLLIVAKKKKWKLDYKKVSDGEQITLKR